jgi:hypothetical protein
MTYKIKNKKLKEQTFYKVEEVKDKIAIDETNTQLENMQIPIIVKNKNILIVKADGKKHEITRENLKAYSQERGSMSGYRQLGSIGGDWRMIDIIADDVEATFNMYDKNRK